MKSDVSVDDLLAAAMAAGTAAMTYFQRGERTSADVSYKTGNSPVSAADIAANDVLEKRLRRAYPDLGWISEETVDDVARLAVRHVFVVDPIDGTRAFIAGDPYWSVSVALVTDGLPVAGVVHAPALGVTYRAARGAGAWCNDVAVSCSARETLSDGVIAGPRPFLDRLERASGVSFSRGRKTPSLALRLVQTGEGAFDASLASEGAHEWDIAAADVFLREAGGVLVDEAGQALNYNRSDLRRGWLAAGPPALAQATVAALRLRP